MLVSELIALLSEYPGDMRVLRAKDDEWNSIYQVHGVDESLADNPLDYDVDVANEEDVENGEFFDWAQDREMTVDDFVKVLVIS